MGNVSRLGPCKARVLDLARMRTGTSMWVQCEAEEINASEVHCPEGLNIQLSGGVYVDAQRAHSAALTLTYHNGQLMLADTAFESPATIADSSLAGNEITSGEPQPVPRLLSLKRVDGRNLTLARLNLQSCRFLDCYNRDQLRIDGPPLFAEQAPGRRWARRRVLAEEHLWRAKYDQHPSGSFPPECRHPDEGEGFPRHEPRLRNKAAAREEAAGIQSVYRDLRKGREDAKDDLGPQTSTTARWRCAATPPYPAASNEAC